MRFHRVPGAWLALLLLVVAADAVEAGSNCARQKLKAVDQLVSCRLSAWRRSERSGTPPTENLASCDLRFDLRWQLLDEGVDCPTVGDGASIRADTATCIDAVAGRLVPKVIFTTAALWTPSTGGGPGTFTHVSGADLRCQQTADLVEALRGKTWRAWISGAEPGGPVRSAAERTTQSAGPYVRPDGVLVAVNFAGLVSGNLLAPLSVDERGDVLPDAWGVWTGTKPDGGAGPATERCRHVDDWSVAGGGVVGRIGNPSHAGTTWTEWDVEDCQSQFHLYCIEQ